MPPACQSSTVSSRTFKPTTFSNGNTCAQRGSNSDHNARSARLLLGHPICGGLGSAIRVSEHQWTGRPGRLLDVPSAIVTSVIVFDVGTMLLSGSDIR